MELTIEENELNAEQFLSLKESVGWTGDISQIEKALSSGLYNVTIKKGNEVIGMGRLIGDGVMYWYIQDIVVLPKYQKCGVGKTIIEHLYRYIEKESISGTTVSIGLLAAKGKEPFYSKFGFIERPTDAYGAGMIKNHLVP